MQKSCYFYIDDVIWVFRDLTRQRPASIFDHHFLKVLKETHDKYGMKVQMNVFYRTDFFYGNDEFTLADMTDAYKAEFEEASDWMKFTLHSKQEFPDYPFLNISYQDMKDIFGWFLVIVGVVMGIINTINGFAKKPATTMDVVVDDEWEQGMPIPKFKAVQAVEELNKQYKRGQLSRKVYEEEKKRILKR